MRLPSTKDRERGRINPCGEADFGEVLEPIPHEIDYDP